jgi:hypothetical protein
MPTPYATSPVIQHLATHRPGRSDPSAAGHVGVRAVRPSVSGVIPVGRAADRSTSHLGFRVASKSEPGNRRYRPVLLMVGSDGSPLLQATEAQESVLAEIVGSRLPASPRQGGVRWKDLTASSVTSI